MPYGLEIRDSGGSIILQTSNRTIRLAATIPVTSPSSGTTTIDISSIAPSANSNNSIAVLENGAATTVPTSGQVVLETAYFETTPEYNTKLKIFIFD